MFTCKSTEMLWHSSSKMFEKQVYIVQSTCMICKKWRCLRCQLPEKHPAIRISNSLHIASNGPWAIWYFKKLENLLNLHSIKFWGLEVLEPTICSISEESYSLKVKIQDKIWTSVLSYTHCYSLYKKRCWADCIWYLVLLINTPWVAVFIILTVVENWCARHLHRAFR